MNSVQTISQPGAIVNHLYFANSSFMDDGSVIVSSNHGDHLGFYRVLQGTWKQLGQMSGHDPRMPANARPNINFRYSGVIARAMDRFFWVDGNAICSCDARSGEQAERVTIPEVAEIGEPLSYYPGGDFIFFFCIQHQCTTFGRMHIASSRIEWGPRTDFLGNHVHGFSPDGDLFLFARESTCIEGMWYHNPHRVWIGSFKTGHTAPYYVHENRGGDMFEHIGHEMADESTGTVIAARYKSSPVGAPGVVRLRQNAKPELIWAGPAWHPAISSDGQRIICDCQPEQDQGLSQLVLLDLKTSSSRIVGQSYTRGGHPYHPHPSIDAGGQHIAYIERDLHGKEAVVHTMTV